MRRAKMTIAQHLELGGRLVDARHAIMAALNTRASAAARRALRNLETVQSELDSEICAMTAKNDPRNLAIAVYYGKLVPNSATAGAADDAFAGWGRHLTAG